VNNLPYVKSGLILAKTLNLSKEVLFLGECGEYELLFTLSKEAEEEFLNEVQKKKLKFYKIGEVKEEGSKLLRERGRKIDLTTYDLSARNYATPKEYLKDVAHFIKTSMPL
jgi:thiamine-monophosphate kinase